MDFKNNEHERIQYLRHRINVWDNKVKFPSYYKNQIIRIESKEEYTLCEAIQFITGYYILFILKLLKKVLCPVVARRGLNK